YAPPTLDPQNTSPALRIRSGSRCPYWQRDPPYPSDAKKGASHVRRLWPAKPCGEELRSLWMQSKHRIRPRLLDSRSEANGSLPAAWQGTSRAGCEQRLSGAFAVVATSHGSVRKERGQKLSE